MIRLLLLALLFFLAYTVFTAIVRSLPRRGSNPRSGSRPGEEMVRDPQCGTFVPRSMALEKSVRGERHFFCSERCRDMFVGRK